MQRRSRERSHPKSGAMMFYFSIAVMAGGIGVVIMAQDEIIQEKQSGTAAWILSKPATRQSFILTKLLSNIIGVLIFIVAVPGLVALGEIFLATNQCAPGAFPGRSRGGLAGAGLRLEPGDPAGRPVRVRGPVLGIAFGIIFGGMLIVNYVPKIAYVLPVAMDKIALLVTQGMPLPAMMVSELISTPVLSILFILVALWRFQHIEF